MNLNTILNDHISGASTLLKQFVLFAKAQFTNVTDWQEPFSSSLSDVRLAHPSMAVFASLDKYVKKQIHFHDELSKILQRFMRQLEDHISLTIDNAVQLLKPFRRFTTLSHSVIVKRFIEQLSPEKSCIHILESRPMNEGVLLARYLNRKGYMTTLRVDAAMKSALEESDVLVLGADVICYSGVINKIGSVALAVLAKQYNIACYILADSSKVLPDFEYMHETDQHPSEEVIDKNSGLVIKNPYFELIPWRDITGWINEKGVFWGL